MILQVVRSPESADNGRTRLICKFTGSHLGRRNFFFFFRLQALSRGSGWRCPGVAQLVSSVGAGSKPAQSKFFSFFSFATVSTAKCFAMSWYDRRCRIGDPAGPFNGCNMQIFSKMLFVRNCFCSILAQLRGFGKACLHVCMLVPNVVPQLRFLLLSSSATVQCRRAEIAPQLRFLLLSSSATVPAS